MAKLDFEQAKKYDQNQANEFLNNNSNIAINPFTIGSRLCA